MLEVEYKSDMHNNYMIINEDKEKQTTSYGLNMLLNNRIPGLLKLELRVIDNFNQYYYDITSKQAIQWVFEKGQLSREQVRHMMFNLIYIIDKSKEFLLSEDDFVLSPDYIFINLSNLEVSLCHVLGYQKDIRMQIGSIIEYLMNKVDHREEGAALLIYSLYKVSKEETCTFSQLFELLEEQELRLEKGDKKMEQQAPQIAMEEQPELPPKAIKVQPFKEEIRTEEEVKEYSKISIAYCAISVIITISIFVAASTLGLVYDKATRGMDFVKAFTLLLVVGGIEAYVLSRILEKNNKVVKIHEKVEYVEVGQDTSSPSFFYKGDMEPVKTISSETLDHTVVLAERILDKTLKLIPLDKMRYEDILLTEFPFFIGALKRKVNYSIGNQSVSKFHAKLEMIGEQFYITDLNSINGTYINQIRLDINERKQLQLEDEVDFADVRYRFTRS